jgi:hypothetical protein
MPVKNLWRKDLRLNNYDMWQQENALCFLIHAKMAHLCVVGDAARNISRSQLSSNKSNITIGGISAAICFILASYFVLEYHPA